MIQISNQKGNKQQVRTRIKQKLNLSCKSEGWARGAPVHTAAAGNCSGLVHLDGAVGVKHGLLAAVVAVVVVLVSQMVVAVVVAVHSEHILVHFDRR